MGAIDKVLAQLDDLSDKAIQKRILGVGDDAPAEVEAEAPVGDGMSVEVEAKGDELSPELVEKLKAFLSKG